VRENDKSPACFVVDRWQVSVKDAWLQGLQGLMPRSPKNVPAVELRQTRDAVVREKQSQVNGMTEGCVSHGAFQKKDDRTREDEHSFLANRRGSAKQGPAEKKHA